MISLKRFRGGVKLEDNKALSSNRFVPTYAIPNELVIPICQHIGSEGLPIVDEGDYVYKGQALTRLENAIGAVVHAPTSGTIKKIDRFPYPHTAQLVEPCIVLRPDFKDNCLADKPKFPRSDTPSYEELIKIVKASGIVGLGGAVFPSSIKLSVPNPIHTLIINGVECEPYITCDDTLMQWEPENILAGVLLIANSLNVQNCLIAIEDNKPAAFNKMSLALAEIQTQFHADSVNIIKVPTIFPSGGEKQLIRIMTGKEIPKGQRAFTIGMLCINVGTAAAIHDAVYFSQPLISRIVTITGEGVSRPGNYRLPIGLPIRDALKLAGIREDIEVEIIMGGPMMGQKLYTADAPIIKATNCLLVKKKKVVNAPVMPCIRCGQCASVCPVELMPQELYWHSRAKNLGLLEKYHLSECIECGCCAAVCPSHIPLVHYFRFAKSEIKEQEVKKQFAQQSRERSEARKHRLERINKEKEAKRTAKKASRASKKKHKVSETTGTHKNATVKPTEISQSME